MFIYLLILLQLPSTKHCNLRSSFYHMFYYRDHLPIKGTIVVAQLIHDEENDNCLYVTLPEFNNSRGIIQKAELPKKVKKQKETLNNLKHQHGGTIICTVSETTKINQTTNFLELVELSIRGVDKKYESKILTRQRNMERIIKLIKYISIQFNLPYESLIHEIQNNIILPLVMDDVTAIDNSNGGDINDYSDTYSNFLRSPQTLLTEININSDSDNYDNILATLKTLIKETNATSSLDFEVKIWKSNNNPNIIQTLRALFDSIKSKFNNIDLRYIGAPTYQINIRAIDPNAIDEFYRVVNQHIIDWFANNGVTGYDLQFDITQKKVKHGDVTIHYPKIEGVY